MFAKSMFATVLRTPAAALNSLIPREKKSTKCTKICPICPSSLPNVMPKIFGFDILSIKHRKSIGIGSFINS